MARGAHIALVLLLGGCGAEIGQSGGDLGDSPDASVILRADAAASLPDASLPDAAPPCTEGDDRVESDDGGCYMYFQTEQSWQQAENVCLSLGGHLASIGDGIENTLVFSIAPAAAALPDVWVGGTDVDTEGVWTWISGDPWSFTQWRESEPNNGGLDGELEHCQIIEGDNPLEEWDDRPCANLYPYICERR